MKSKAKAPVNPEKSAGVMEGPHAVESYYWPRTGTLSINSY